jgi:hypothetical protein
LQFLPLLTGLISRPPNRRLQFTFRALTIALSIGVRQLLQLSQAVLMSLLSLLQLDSVSLERVSRLLIMLTNQAIALESSICQSTLLGRYPLVCLGAMRIEFRLNFLDDRLLSGECGGVFVGNLCQLRLRRLELCLERRQSRLRAAKNNMTISTPTTEKN